MGYFSLTLTRMVMLFTDNCRLSAYSTTKMRLFQLGLFFFMLVFGQFALANTIVIDFEGFSDGTSITTQYPGFVFSNATAITAGISLNEFEFPTHSGTNVAFDDAGPITIDFTNPIVSFGGYFTYGEQLTLRGLDGFNNPLSSVLSAFSNNEAISGVPGSAPNEFLSLNSVTGISSVTITGDPTGGSFTLDDVTVNTPPSNVVPEPSGLGVAGLVIFAMAAFLRPKWHP